MGRLVQRGLFESISKRPTLNIVREQKLRMNAAAKACGLSREAIVEKMNDLARAAGVRLVKGGGPLTMATFEKWLNIDDASRNMPCRALPIFCTVVGDIEALRVMVTPLDCDIVGPEDVKKLAWADAQLAIKRRRQEIRKIEAEL